jgi:hypothetical protein
VDFWALARLAASFRSEIPLDGAAIVEVDMVPSFCWGGRLCERPTRRSPRCGVWPLALERRRWLHYNRYLTQGSSGFWLEF